MSYDFPAPYKLVFAERGSNSDTPRHVREYGVWDFDCLEDPIPKDPLKPLTYLAKKYSYYTLESIKEIIEYINSRPEVEGTEYKYYLQNWEPDEKHYEKFSLSLKLGRARKPAEVSTQDSPATSIISAGMATSTSETCGWKLT